MSLGTPQYVEAATLRSLEKLPADRFATAAQFAEALATASFASPAREPAPAPQVKASRVGTRCNSRARHSSQRP